MKATNTMTIGCDLGDRFSHLCGLDQDGEVLFQERIKTTPAGFRGFFGKYPGATAILEVGTHSPWISRLLTELSVEPVVANTRRVKLISENHRKSDSNDAEFLARLGRADRKLLAPIQHRGAEAQQHLAVIRARDTLVDTRRKLVNHVRGMAKSFGERVTKCTTPVFADRARDSLPKQLVHIVEPVLRVLEQVSEEIRKLNMQIAQLCKKHEDTDVLRQVNGVGPIVSLTYILTLDDPHRFRRSRDVGAYLGLSPRRAQSGDYDPQLRISKTGDKYLRKLLVTSAHRILGPKGEDSDLRRWGLRLAQGGPRAKKRAIVAVARRLAVMLHRLWKTGEVYQPFTNAA